MRWLTDERGASAVIVAVFTVALIGMAAFAIDVGAMYQERRELQNGADAAALAIAEDCATGAVPCSPVVAAATADAYADGNATDGAAQVPTVALDTIGQSVTVTAATEQVDGATALAPFFAQVVGFDGSTVGASATAIWGHLGSRAVVPLIISECEWDEHKDEIQPEPPFGGPNPPIFYIHDGGSVDPCHDSGSGFDLPGGFGWLDTTAAEPCQADVEEYMWAPTDPGASPSNGCTPPILRRLMFPDLYGTENPNGEVFIPYFFELDGTGNNIEYRVKTIGAFFITGYNFGGQYKEARDGYSIPCSGDERCFAGFLIEATSYEGETGGNDRGVLLVKLTN